MNICFIIGEVIDEVDFKFYYCNKKTSVAKTKIKLEDGSIITISGYDEKADWLFRKLNVNDNIFIEGRLESNMQIEIINAIIL